MISLDKSKNDTSITLDLLRATAAQMVSVGHAINFGGIGRTSAPSLGVLIFFILSGFVIAYTLQSKTNRDDYYFGRYAIERISRIYCAYFPAMLLIGAGHIATTWVGLKFEHVDPTNISTFMANLFMLQMYPMSSAFGTFGTAGQLNTIAQEFHIYFFVGALYFLCIGRQRILASIVAVLSTRMPLGNFLAFEARALFLLWLIGFSIYFLVRSIKIDGPFAALFSAVAIGIIYFWHVFSNTSNLYDIANFPALALVFMAIIVTTQCYRWIAASPMATKVISFFASYSLTLFLLHLTIVRIIYASWDNPSVSRAIMAIFVANLCSAALAFSPIGEIHYKRLGGWIGGLVYKPSQPASAQSEER